MDEASSNIEEGRGGRLFDPGRPRRSVNLLQRAVREGWDIPDKLRVDMPLLAESIARGDLDNRTRIKAIDTLRMMAKDNVDAAIALDRIERLDAGESTENQSHKIEVRHVNLIDGTHTD